jgi:hypothetical protein
LFELDLRTNAERVCAGIMLYFSGVSSCITPMK